MQTHAQCDAAEVAVTLKAPSLAQRLAYVECLKFQRARLRERGAGRSGYLSEVDEQAHSRAYAIVDQALENGVGFDIGLLTEELDREDAGRAALEQG